MEMLIDIHKIQTFLDIISLIKNLQDSRFLYSHYL